jgi:hypothetical protein
MVLSRISISKTAKRRFVNQVQVSSYVPKWDRRFCWTMRSKLGFKIQVRVNLPRSSEILYRYHLQWSEWLLCQPLTQKTTHQQNISSFAGPYILPDHSDQVHHKDTKEATLRQWCRVGGGLNGKWSRVWSKFAWLSEVYWHWNQQWRKSNTELKTSGLALVELLRL